MPLFVFDGATLPKQLIMGLGLTGTELSNSFSLATTPTYGEMTISSNTGTSITLTLQNTWYPINTLWVADQNNNVITNTVTGSLTVNFAGVYETLVSMSIFAGGSNHTFQIAIFKNGIPLSEHQAVAKFSSTNVTNMMISGIDKMNANDILSLQVLCQDAAGQIITIQDCNFNIFMI